MSQFDPLSPISFGQEFTDRSAECWGKRPEGTEAADIWFQLYCVCVQYIIANYS